MASIVYPSLEDAKIAYGKIDKKIWAIVVYKNGWAEIKKRHDAHHHNSIKEEPNQIRGLILYEIRKFTDKLGATTKGTVELADRIISLIGEKV